MPSEYVRKLVTEYGVPIPVKDLRKVKILERTIMLSDVNMENIAEIQIFSNDAGEKWVKAFPYASMHEMMRMDMSNPILLMDGVQYMPQMFLGYIAQVIRYTMDTGGHFFTMTLRDGPDGTYTVVRLLQGVSSKEIAALTGFDLQMVRDFYSDYFVVKG
jgi:hypothetical protein